MFEADVAPEWAEGEVCHRCRTQFGLVTRQHHCRACGQVFCSKCSSKSCVLPKFGIEKEVRVCDSCFDEYGPKDYSNTSETSSPARRRNVMDPNRQDESTKSSTMPQGQGGQTKASKTEEEIKEEEDLQLAIALSQSEAEEQEKRKKQGNYSQNWNSPEKKAAVGFVDQTRKEAGAEEEISPELMRYLNRDFWEQKEKEKANAKESVNDQATKQKDVEETVNRMSSINVRNNEAITAEINMKSAGVVTKNDDELDEFVTTLKTQVEIFVNRMKSNSSRGRSIANDSSVQTLFMNTMAMHSQLLKHIQDQEDRRVYFEGLQDKLTQVKDARAALEALREEERERKRREAEEAERQRQIQMQEKLEIMRQKKQEYLQYQRQLALQRMQEQERELLMRQEAAKQQYMLQQPQPQMHPGTGGMATHPGMAGMPPSMFSSVPGAPPFMQATSPYGYNDPSMAIPPAYQSVMMNPTQASIAPQQQGQQQPAMNPLAIHDPNLAPPPPGLSSNHSSDVSLNASYNMQAMAAALPPTTPTVPSIHPYQQGGVVQSDPNTLSQGQSRNDQLISFD